MSSSLPVKPLLKIMSILSLPAPDILTFRPIATLTPRPNSTNIDFQFFMITFIEMTKNQV